MIGIVAAYSLAYLFGSNPFDLAVFGHDTAIYRDAAARLAAGGELYPAQEGEMLYRYAPWFAALWIPTPLIADWGWLALLIGCSAFLLWPLLRIPDGWIGILLLAPLLVETAWIGNADPAVVALMAMWASRWGPVGIGIAGSLKLAPLVFVLLYLWRGEWARAGVALGVFALLWLPGVPLGILNNPIGPTTITPQPAALALAIGFGFVATGLVIAWRSERYRVAGVGLAYVGLLIPRTHLGTTAVLLTAFHASRSPERSTPAAGS